jgi:NAD(P)H dehydrogenase (quinone)
MVKVLVTAPKGQIGLECIHELISQGATVFAGNEHIFFWGLIFLIYISKAQITVILLHFSLKGVRNPASSSDLVLQGATPVSLDLHSSAAIAAAVSQVNVVLLITPTPLERVDDATLEVARAAARAKVHVVRVSLIGSDKNASFEWGKAHGRADDALVGSGAPYTILRCSPLFQSFVALHRWSIDGEAAIYAPLGDAKVVFVDARDVARAAAAICLAQPVNGIVEITGPEALTGEELAERVGQAKERDGRYQNVTEKAARHGMTGAGLPEALVLRIEGLHAAYRRGEFSKVTKDFERITGKRPHSFLDYLIHTLRG